MVVGAARIVPLLDFLEKTNSIQTIILRWLHQLLLLLLLLQQVD
jgi:hypothetical protein